MSQRRPDYDAMRAQQARAKEADRISREPDQTDRDERNDA